MGVTSLKSNDYSITELVQGEDPGIGRFINALDKLIDIPGQLWNV